MYNNNNEKKKLFSPFFSHQGDLHDHSETKVPRYLTTLCLAFPVLLIDIMNKKHTKYSI